MTSSGWYVLPVSPHPLLDIPSWTQGFPDDIPACFSASIPWCYYWVLHSLDLLGATESLDIKTREKILESLRE